jgi:raffinose synthase
MVKVDNQSSLEDFTNGECGRVGSMRLYQEALQGSTQNYFLGNSIHCMSNGSDVAYNMMSANVWRNSDDYYPKRGQDAQQAHVFINALNAFWSSAFCIPDWDMFQTHGPCPEFHAAARALSGGPVYVCDNPNQQNFSIISKLMVSGSKVLKFDGPAQPLEECLYVDAREESAALKILNWRGSVAVLGLFNCKKGEESVKAAYGPSSLPASTGGSYAAYSQLDASVSLLGPKAVKEIELGAASWDLVTLSPVENGVAPLGLLEKYAGAAALQSWGWAEKGRFECSLVDGGLVGLYSKRAPKSVACNGKKLKFKHDAKTGLLSFEAPTGAVALIRIAYES